MYEAFYSLRAKPFQLNPDPNFYFGSRGHKRAMSYLEYGLRQGEGFIVITGEVGAGKTILVRSLLRNLATEQIVAAQLVSTQVDADDMLRLVAAAFGLPCDDTTKAGLLKRLETFLQSCHTQGRRALLIVDEAQNLSPRAVEELRMLSNFQSAETSLLQSFLLGQPEFRQTLQSEGMQQLRQRVIASYHLGPMESDETRAYIEHRLSTVGWRDDPHLADDAYQAIHELTQGIPRKINTLCDRLLLMGYLEEKHRLDRTAVEAVVGEFEEEMAPTVTSESALSDPSIKRALEGLDDRVNEIEQSVFSVLRLMRQLLSWSGVRPMKRENRS